MSEVRRSIPTVTATLPKGVFSVDALLARLTSDDVALIVLFILAFLAGMTVWLTLQWRLHRRTEIEAALKQDMLNRGMSAGEIGRVLKATLTGTATASAAPEESSSSFPSQSSASYPSSVCK
jgi:hypothetical protein